MKGVRRIIMILGSVVTLSGILSSIGLLANILLARNLPAKAFGQFALIISAAQLTALLGDMGQPSILRRAYSLQPKGTFDWPVDMWRTILVSLPTVSIFTLVLGWGYKFSNGLICTLGIITIFQIALLLIYTVLTSQQHYVWASIPLRAPNALLIIPASLGIILPGFRHLYLVLASLITAQALICALGLIVLWHRNIRGTQQITWRERWQGLNFMALGTANLLPQQGLVVIAGFFITDAALAALAALSVLLRPLNILRESLLQFLSVEVVRNKRINHRRWIAGLWGLAVILGIAAIAITPYAASILYRHRYDEFLFLLLPITIAGVLWLPDIFPRTYIVGATGYKTLRWFVIANLVASAFGLGITIWLAENYKIVGIAWAGVALIIIRVAISFFFYFMARLRHDPKPQNDRTDPTF